MTEQRMGENIQREWDEDPFALEVWEACNLLKRDRDAGTAMLADLGERGSPLAMMYLGSAYVSGGASDDVKLGEKWLIRSAAAGSIEGRYQLARHYWEPETWEKAERELKSLATQGYAPGMYCLGLAYYHGRLCERSIPDAIRYLKMASDAGHIPALGQLSRIYFKEKQGLLNRLTSHWYCLAKIPSLVRCMLYYPNSDRLRGGPKLRSA